MSHPIIIGAGHNGLSAAFYLAKAGLKPLVLEARDTVGGGAITSELHPGFRCPTLTHHTLLASDIVRDMDLQGLGVEFLTPPVEVFAPGQAGEAVVYTRDARRTADTLARVSGPDARSYPAYREAMDRVSSVLASLLAYAPPDVDHPSAGDVWRLLRTGRRFRALGRRDGYRLLRWAAMPLADLMREWFESEVLCAATAAPGLSGTLLGPRSAGGGLVLLLHEASTQRAHPATRIRGGPGALTAAMAAAARRAGAEIRTAVQVDRIVVRDDRVVAVVAEGREIPAATVISAVDPKTTFLRLVEAIDASPDFMLKIRNYRASGAMAKVNLALAALPAFAGTAETLAGRIHLGPDLDYLEQAFDCAKYGEVSDDPWLEVTIPSILDDGLAPQGAHVMSIYVHYAPYRLRGGAWPAANDDVLGRVVKVLDRFAPGIKSLILAAEVINPAELEATYGFYGGHVFHGELALDQLFAMRPILGYAGYASPIHGLHLCSAGTHPGGFLTGTSGRLAAACVIKTAKAR